MPPSNADELGSLGSLIDTYKVNATYLNLRLMAGYTLPFKMFKHYTIDLKAGINSRSYFTGAGNSRFLRMQLVTPQRVVVSELTIQDISLGACCGAFSMSQNGLLFDVGITRNLSSPYLKYLTLGVEVTRSFVLGGPDYGSGRIIVESFTINSTSRPNGNHYPSSVDKYRVKDLSVGLRLTAGLWHR